MTALDRRDDRAARYRVNYAHGPSAKWVLQGRRTGSGNAQCSSVTPGPMGISMTATPASVHYDARATDQMSPTRAADPNLHTEAAILGRNAPDDDGRKLGARESGASLSHEPPGIHGGL